MMARHEHVRQSTARRHSKRLIRMSIAAVLVIVGNLLLSAQLAQMKPGAETQRLNFLQGAWLTEESQTIAGNRHHVRSTSTYEWLPGDLWLRGTTSMTGLPGIETLHAWAQFTYDPRSHEYVMVHTDNQSALVFESRGRWTDKNTLVLEGSHPWEGRTVHRRTVFALVSDDEFTREYLTSADGATYSRRSLTRYVRRVQAASELM